MTPAGDDIAETRRLLFLAPFAPRLDAGHGGGRAMAGLLSGLAQRNRVGLLYLRGDGEPGIDEALRARLDLVEEFPRFGRNRAVGLRRRLHKQARAAAALFSFRPTWATHSRVPALAARLRELVPTWRPDVVQAEYHVMGQYLEGLHGFPARRVLNQYEPGVGAARELWRSSRGLERLRDRLDLLAWERFERRVASLADAMVVFTNRDRAALAPYADGVPIVTIPLGTELPETALDPAGEAPEILFHGNFHHPPNVDAATRLARSIFSRVRERRPDARLTLVGEAPPEGLEGPGIEVTGFVPDLRPYLNRAAVVAAPLHKGGGMRVKILEALAAGKAVVASPLAVEGIGARDGEEAVLAETDGDFAAAIAGLLEERDRRVALGTRARAWAVENLGWERTVRRYEDLYDSLLLREAGISVAISTLDRPDELARCLDALAAGSLLPAEVVVVDQSRDDRTRAVVEERKGGPFPIVYVRQEARGLGTAQNEAVSRASRSIVAVTDDDCIPDRDWLAAIARAFIADLGFDAVTGRVLPLEPRGERVCPVSSRTRPERRDFRGRTVPWEVGSGNNFALRKSWFERVAGNDERLGPGSPGRGGVDMDLFYRLLRAGARIRYEPESLVFHERQTRAERRARRPMYGHGMGACCALWLRQGDLYALRVLAGWLGLRMRLAASALRRGQREALAEEGLLLAGTARGFLHGLRLRTPGEQP
ncbi:MAG TPA: glycosyltransferase [Thermoanaerobaculia bacterium]|jgi:glycosyltransferase involved in cell wall biosynthesis|nr:glycosyltransferase [Thermoanaerobaculia bacterium]